MLGRFGAWFAVALLGAVVLVGCGKETTKEENPPTVTQVPVTYEVPTAGPSTPTAATGGATQAATQPSSGGGAQVVNLDMEDIKFVPDTLTIPANTDVTIHIVNKGATAHDFSIDELKISTGDVQPGDSIDVKINAPAGTYTYYCNIPGHEAAGMKGTLTVAEGASTNGGAAESTPPAPAENAASPAASAVVSPAANGALAQTVDLNMEDIKFSKDALTIPANTDVTIHLTNTGATDHDFSIDALKISTGPVAPGKSVDVKINAPAGTYTYYCNIPGHEAAGMKGTLTVTEAAPAAEGAASPAASPVASPVSSLVASPISSPVASPVASPIASPAATNGGAQTINVDMEDIKFSTNSIEIPANTDVTIHLTNKGVTDHDFSIDALKISTGPVAPGASVDVKINAPAGTYTYYCNIPGHEAAGMKGTLTVK